MSVEYRYNLAELFMALRMHPKHPMNEPGRLTGRHCNARLQRAKAKRRKAGKTPYTP